MSNIQQVNDLVALGETRRYTSVYQSYADSQITDPNGAATPAAVGLGLAGAKSLLVEVGGAGAGSVRVWLYRSERNLSAVGTPGMGWAVPRDGDLGAVDGATGASERFDVSGFARVYVEVYDGTGDGLDVVYGVGVLP